MAHRFASRTAVAVRLMVLATRSNRRYGDGKPEHNGTGAWIGTMQRPGETFAMTAGRWQTASTCMPSPDVRAASHTKQRQHRWSHPMASLHGDKHESFTCSTSSAGWRSAGFRC